MATNQYVAVDFDEFENKTQFSHRDILRLTNDKWKLRRVLTAKLDLLLLDYDGASFSGGCIGRVIISYDGETVDADRIVTQRAD